MSSDALSTVKMPAYTPRGVEQASGRAREATAQVARQEQKQAPEPPPTAEAVKAAAAQIDSYLRSTNRELDFRVDSETGQMIVSVRDKETGDLIRQIPGEEVLRMARALKAGSAALVNLTV
jgi:flagellar protein FlaG